MLFGTTELAARIERAERDLVASACALVQRRTHDAFLADFGGGFAAFTEPGSPLNKVVGLGFAPFDETAWLAIEAELMRRGPVQVELSTLADPALGKFLTGRGYQLVGVENVSGRALAGFAAPPPPDGVEVAVCPPPDLDRWLDVVTTGFASPDAQGLATHETFAREVIERVIRDFAGARGLVLFLAHCGGEPAGAGSMRLDGTLAQLCGASTLPAQRRRGVQSALLAHRLAFAAERGCDLALVTTQPGSKSQQNMHRQGFELLYSRNVLVRSG